MEFRDSFSKLKKKVKHRLTGNKSKPNKTEADVGEESVDSAGSRPGSGPHVVAGGGQDLSTIRLPQPGEPGFTPARGSVNDQARGAGVDGREVEQTRSHLHSVDVEVAEGSGPAKGNDIDGKVVEQVDLSPSTTPIPHDGKPDST